MNVIAFNGSPRKNGNTATLLQHALNGAASQGAQTELIHLYDLDFKGCTSCLACKLKGGVSYGRCAQRDELTPLLAKAEEADAILLGSPNYAGSPTGTTRSFVERLLFPYVVYDQNLSSLFKRKINAGFIYTMGSSPAWMKEAGYAQAAELLEKILAWIFGSAESLIVADTSLFDDYSRYVATRFDPVEKARIRAEEFPLDCRRAFEMGARFAQAAVSATGG